MLKNTFGFLTYLEDPSNDKPVKLHINVRANYEIF